MPIPGINTGDYAGIYEMPQYTQFILSKTANGDWQAYFNTFRENEYRHAAKLEKIQIEGALLTGILRYDNGRGESFSLVFIERTVNDKKELGIAIRQPIPVPA